MKQLAKRFLLVGLVLALLCTGAVTALAADQTAEDISQSTTRSGGGEKCMDGKDRTTYTSKGDVQITLDNAKGMGSLYILLNLEYESFTVTDNATQKSVTVDASQIIHLYVNLVEAFGTAPSSITLDFNKGKVEINEIHVLSQGEAPDWVQQWKAPCETGADLVLFSTHGDDEQLFFAGMLPYYAAEKGYRVQVVYLTTHRNDTKTRVHEMLNGLWSVGVTHYPVFGEYDDFFEESLQKTYQEFKRRGWEREEMLGWVVEQLRRFKPLVAVGHDFAGEYKHGQHMVYSDLLAEAITISMDETKYPESAAKYGVYDVPKTYIHLYEENPIVMDWDQPLESFDGMTAFQVTQKRGYPCHISQQWTWFTGWINGKSNQITKASEIKTHSPCKFGLYRTTVGLDVQKDDFFENIPMLYAEKERLEEEARLEAERLEEERRQEEARLEEERRQEEARKEAEEQARREEQERLAREEAARLEAERLKRESQRRKFLAILALLVMLIVALVAVFIVLANRAKRRKRRRRKK